MTLQRLRLAAALSLVVTLGPPLSARAHANTRFNHPAGVTLTPDGSIYIADHRNRRVRRIGPDGIVNTVAGGGTELPTNELLATAAVLGGPWDVAVDPAGESVYFTDYQFHQVWKLSTPAITGDFEKYVPSEDGALLYVFDPAGRHLRTEDSVTRQALWTFRYTAYPLAGGGETRLLTEAEDAFGNVLTIERSADGTPTAIVAPFGQRTDLQVDANGYLREVRRALEFGSERVELTLDAGGLLRSLKTPKDQLYGYVFDSEGRLERVSDPELGELALGFQSTPLGHKVTLTTAENRISSTEVSFLPNREIRQVVTAPTGKQVEVLARQDGSFEWTYPDDTEVVVETAPDPRLGARSRILRSRLLVTPEGQLEQFTEWERTVTTAGGDPLALGNLTDLVRVNGREATTTYTAADRTVRNTSPEGRTGEAVFDAFGRLVETRSPGVLPVQVDYDARGRLQEVRQGTGQEERKATVAYNPDGFVDTVTDPLLRTTRFEYDRVGRVTKTILPDLREVRFEYDLNGNVTKVTPPARPNHRFAHNDVDQVERYEPPDLDPGTPEIPATTYAYDRDHRLTTITRPDGQVVTVQYDAGGRVEAVVAPTHTIDLAYDADTGKLAAIAGPDGTTVGYDYDGPWIEEVTLGGPITATVQLQADRPEPGFPTTNFWLGRLTLNDDPATEIEVGRWLGSHVGDTGVRVSRNPFGELERLVAYGSALASGHTRSVASAVSTWWTYTGLLTGERWHDDRSRHHSFSRRRLRPGGCRDRALRRGARSALLVTGARWRCGGCHVEGGCQETGKCTCPRSELELDGSRCTTPSPLRLQRLRVLSTEEGGRRRRSVGAETGLRGDGHRSKSRRLPTDRRGARRAIIVLALAFVASGSCARDTAIFRFQPEEGAVYRVTEVEEVRETTTARSGVGLEREEMEARIEVRRPDSWRWAFVMTAQRFEVYDQGVQLGNEHPFVAALVGSPLTIEVWEDGTVAGVSGLEEVDRKLRAAVGRPGAPPMLGLALARAMEAELRAEWAERVAPFIGREAAVGERWEQILERPLPTGGALGITRELTFEGWEDCGPGRCARLRHVDRGGGTEWSEALETVVNEFARSLCPNAQRVEVLEVTIAGEGERLVEPETLFTLRASDEEKVMLRVRLDDGEEQVVSREGKSTLRAERMDGEEV